MTGERQTAGGARLHVPEISWEWEKAEYIPEWHEPLYEVVARYVPEGASVLEVGAGGSATLGMLAARRGCRAIGCEPDAAGVETALRLAAREGAHVHVIRGDGFALPFADAAFDVVYSLGLVEHFSPPETAALVAEHRRVCRRGGRVIVSVPNLLNLPHTLYKAASGKRYRYHPERSFSPRKLRSLLEAAGLRPLARDGLLPLWGWGMMPGGWRVTAALKRLGLASRLDGLRSPALRAALGYMTFAVGERVD